VNKRHKRFAFPIATVADAKIDPAIDI